MGQYSNLANLFLNRMPTYLVFHITSLCNARCKMCFNWKQMNKNREKELSLDEVNKFSKSLGPVVYLSLGGGEPFMRKDISKIAEIFYKNNKTRIFQIATNCLLPKIIENQCELILKNCKEAILKITLSLDGIGKQHDYVRGVRGNFQKFLETYELLHKLRDKYNHLEILVNTVYSKYTEKNAEKIYDWVKNNLNIDMHSFTYVRGDTREKKARNVSIENYGKLIEYVEEDYRKRRFISKNPFRKVFPVLSVLTRRCVLEELRNNAKGRKRIFKCLAAKKMLHIDPFGNVFPCEYLPNKKLGNLRDFDCNIKKILNLDTTKQILKSIKNKECSCTWECAIKNSIVYDIKKWPTILKEISRLK